MIKIFLPPFVRSVPIKRGKKGSFAHKWSKMRLFRQFSKHCAMVCPSSASSLLWLSNDQATLKKSATHLVIFITLEKGNRLSRLMMFFFKGQVSVNNRPLIFEKQKNPASHLKHLLLHFEPQRYGDLCG